MDVIGTKDSVVGAVSPCSVPTPELIDPVQVIQTVLGEIPKITLQGHSLGITLMSLNGYVHPSIMYGQWKVTINKLFFELSVPRIALMEVPPASTSIFIYIKMYQGTHLVYMHKPHFIDGEIYICVTH